MPILTSSTAESTFGSMVVRLEGLPDFNVDSRFVVTDFAGLRSRSVPDAVLVPTGGAPGAFAAGEWLPGEKYYTLAGLIQASGRGERDAFGRLLHAALPVHRDAVVQVLGGDDQLDLQVFVRNYDVPEVEFKENRIRFSFPLVAPDPFKYALEPLAGDMGVFSGVDWYRTYDVGTTPPSRTYVAASGVWSRTYQRDEAAGEYPLEMGLDSPGDATSRRVTTEVVGPLPLGWWVERQDEAGVVVERVWAESALSDGQTLVLDTSARSARLNGADVSHLVFGDFLTLPAGPSTYRLVAPSDLGGHASVSALPAYL